MLLSYTPSLSFLNTRTLELMLSSLTMPTIPLLWAHIYDLRACILLVEAGMYMSIGKGKSAMTAETEREGVGGLISALKWI